MGQSTAEMIREGKDITRTLSEVEEQALKKYEEIISKGLNTFLEVGHALAEIRDRRLYRATHDTFEPYCREVWDFSKTHANRHIGGYETVKLLETQMTPMGAKTDNDTKMVPIGTDDVPQEILLPINERQTRPLTKLKDPDDQVAAWNKVLEYMNADPQPKLTAALVARAVREIKGEAVKKTIKNTKAQVKKTARVSNIFKRQYQVLLDIVVEERNKGWKTAKQKEVIKHLEALIKIVNED